MAEFTQGICADGAAILKDGVMLTVEEIIELLRQGDALMGQGEPVAFVGDAYSLHWIGSGPIAPIIERTRLKPGDKLYTQAPAVPAQGGEAWRCYHCDEVFHDHESAREHFGATQYKDPACQIDIAKYRDMEETLRRFHNEDTDFHREIHALHTEKVTAVRRAEEQGYSKGLEDAKRHPGELGLMPITAPVVDDGVVRDAARLNWIDRNHDFEFRIVVDRPHDGEYEVQAGRITAYGKTLRAAIDNAMAKEQGDDNRTH